MTVHSSDLAQTIRAMWPMTCDPGFQARLLNDDLAEMSLGACTFLLQNHYVRDWADNCVLHLYVSNLQAWWDRVVEADLATRYGVRTRAPHRADWGATVAHLIDPAGVLWWLHETAQHASDGGG